MPKMLEATIDFAKIGPVGQLRYLASRHAQCPFPLNLFALNIDERDYWDWLWLTRPDPIDWTTHELCMFDFLAKVASDYRQPWPVNGRLSGIQLAETMARVKAAECENEIAIKNRN